MRGRAISGAVVALAVVVSALAASPAAARTTQVAPDPASAYLASTYELFLHRSPTDHERARWVPTLELGHRRALTRALAVSDEWAGSRVDRLYLDVLGRRADPAGRAWWVGRVAAGHALEAIAAFLHGSDEYWHRSGGDAGGFVDALYEDLLDRSADTGGRQHWVAELDRGVARETVAAGFYGSVESRRDRVTALFEDVLGRAPDAAGLAHWVDAVPRLGDVTLAAALAASDERYRSVTGTEPPPEPPRGWGTGFAPYATVDGVPLTHPTAAVDLIGLHQSGHDGSRQQDPAVTAVRTTTLPSRYRGTGRRTAADIVVPPGTEIRSPVTGTVLAAERYALYCRYVDHRIAIQPDGRPDVVVYLLHIDGVLVQTGQRVDAGITPLSGRARVLPFASQVDRHTARPAWPHVHVEAIDPRVPDEPSGSC